MHHRLISNVLTWILKEYNQKYHKGLGVSEAVLRFDLVLASQPHTAFISSCRPAIYIEMFPATPMKHVRYK